jgi:hypothetical protein
MVGTDDDRVAYCAMLDYVPSVESCSSSSDGTSGSESILALSLPILNIHIEAGVSPIETEAHAVEPEAMHLTFRYTGVRDDEDARADFHQMIQGETSSRLGDDGDEQIVQCLQHVRILDVTPTFYNNKILPT